MRNKGDSADNKSPQLEGTTSSMNIFADRDSHNHATEKERSGSETTTETTGASANNKKREHEAGYGDDDSALAAPPKKKAKTTKHEAISQTSGEAKQDQDRSQEETKPLTVEPISQEIASAKETSKEKRERLRNKKQLKERERETKAKDTAQITLKTLLNSLNLGAIPDMTSAFFKDFLQGTYKPSHTLTAIKTLLNDNPHQKTLYDSCIAATERVILTLTSNCEEYTDSPHHPPSSLRKKESKSDGEDNDEEPTADQKTSTENTLMRLIWSLLPDVTQRREFILANNYDIFVHAIQGTNLHCLRYLVSSSKVIDSDHSNHPSNAGTVDINTYGNDPKIARALLEKMTSVFYEIGSHEASKIAKMKLELTAMYSWYILLTPKTKAILEQEQKIYFAGKPEPGLHSFIDDIARNTEATTDENTRATDKGSSASSSSSSTSTTTTATRRQPKQVSFAADTKIGAKDRKSTSAQSL